MRDRARERVRDRSQRERGGKRSFSRLIYLSGHETMGPFDRAGFDLRIGRKEQARPFHPPLRFARAYLRIGCARIHFFVLRVRNYTYACTIAFPTMIEMIKKRLRYLESICNREKLLYRSVIMLSLYLLYL